LSLRLLKSWAAAEVAINIPRISPRGIDLGARGGLGGLVECRHRAADLAQLVMHHEHRGEPQAVVA
jgi:hypothetical protein